MSWKFDLGVVAAAVLALVGPRLAEKRWEANPDPTGGVPLSLPEGEDLTVTTRDGAAIGVRSCGPLDAPPVVLIHGWTADRRVWGCVAEGLLAAGRRVVAYDQRGHGRSSVGADGLTVAAIGDDLAAVVEELDLHDAVLVGHSMGGMAVQSFATRHKELLAERVASLVLVSTAASSVSMGSAFTKIAGTVVGSSLLDVGMRRPVLGPLLVRGTVGRKAVMSHLRATTETFVELSPRTRRTFLEQMAGMDLRPALREVGTPAVVVSGTLDGLLPHRLSKALAATLPNATLTPFRGAGHQLPFETPERLAEAILSAPATSPTPG